MIYPPDVSRGSRLALLLVLMSVSAWPSIAEAQLGGGDWHEFSPVKVIQLRGAGARYTNENGIETFSTQPGDERAEARIFDDHRSGSWQFEGWVNVKPGVNGGCIHQVFKFLMIVVYPAGGGELRQHSQQKLAATGIYDKWVRVNTIHDVEAGKAEVYIDGTLRGSVTSKSPGPNGWYHKYGIYNSSTTRPVVQWRDVKYFHKGGPPNLPDAGVAPDAQPAPADAGAAMEVGAGSGDATGGRGAGGASGSGGTSGSGGGEGGSGGGGTGAGGASPGSGMSGPAPGSAGRTGAGGAKAANAGGAPAAGPQPSSPGCSYATGAARSANERTAGAIMTLGLAFALALAAWARGRRTTCL